MTRWSIVLASFVIVIGIPPFLVLANVLAVMSPEWLAFQYNQPGFPKADRFNDKDRLYNASESIEYVRGNRTLAQFGSAEAQVEVPSVSLDHVEIFVLTAVMKSKP